MPTMKNYLNFIYVNLGFIAQIAVMMYFKSVLDIKKNWPLYRCNPPYWVFSDNISEDFTYCVQNTQTNLMGFLLEPLNYMVSSLSSIGSEIGDSINNIRYMINNIRRQNLSSNAITRARANGRRHSIQRKCHNRRNHLIIRKPRH